MNGAPTVMLKQRFKLTLAYDGTGYVGWQSQRKGHSIQDTLYAALQRIDANVKRPIASGRTDAGVHALGQVAHVDLNWNHDDINLLRALNRYLPDSIQVSEVKCVDPSFHAQKDAREKWYRYVVYYAVSSAGRVRAQQAAPLLFERLYAWSVDYPLNMRVMRKAAKYCVGQHDFASFQGSGSLVKTTVRDLKKLIIRRTPRYEWPLSPCVGAPLAAPIKAGHWIMFDCVGTGFLKQMVRNIVGTLVDVGRGMIIPDEIQKIMRSKDRKKAGRCAPPSGLYLMRVRY